MIKFLKENLWPILANLISNGKNGEFEDSHNLIAVTQRRNAVIGVVSA